MTKEQNKRIHLIISWIIGVSIVIAGICLMAACIGIYRSGGQPYSREAVSAAFSPIAIPVYLCLVFVVLGFALDLCLPISKTKAVDKQYSAICRRLHERADMSLCNPELKTQIAKEQKSRLIHKGICAALLLVGSVVFLIYALDGSHFHPSEINSSVISAMYILLPCMAVPFAYGIFAAFHARRSIQKEIALLKLAPVAAKQDAPAEKKPNLAVPILRVALLVIGIGVLMYGFLSGGTADVLTKAINICTECVGLG